MAHWVKGFTIKWATLALWRMLSVLALLFGVLPSRGWPLSPRPLTLPAALMLAFGFYASLVFSLLLRVSLDYIPMRKHNETNRVVALVWVGCTGIVILAATWQRHKLVHLAQSILIYLQRFPLSSQGWWILMLLTISRLAVWVVVTATELAMTGALQSVTAPVGVFSTVVTSVLWPLFSCLLYLVVACTIGTLGALAADLREDSHEVIHWASYDGRDKRQHKKPTHDVDAIWSERWRSVRVRQRILHDLVLQANADHGVHVIFILVCESILTTIALSHAVSSYRAEATRRAALAAIMGCTGLFIIALNTYCHQWAAMEFSSLGRSLQCFVVVHGEKCMPLSRKEVDLLIHAIEVQEGRCDVIGLFYLDISFTMALISGIASYLVVCFQFDVGPI